MAHARRVTSSGARGMLRVASGSIRSTPSTTRSGRASSISTPRISAARPGSSTASASSSPRSRVAACRGESSPTSGAVHLSAACRARARHAHRLRRGRRHDRADEAASRPLLHAARALRLVPSACLYLGDDLRDVQARVPPACRCSGGLRLPRRRGTQPCGARMRSSRIHSRP